MTLQLRDGLAFCDCAGRIVLLDLEADRYFCLAPALDESFRLWAASPADGGRDEGATALCQLGILVPVKGRAPAPPRTIPMKVTGDLDGELPPRRRDVVQALVAELVMAGRLRVRPLAKILLGRDNGGPEGLHGPERPALQAARIRAAFAGSALYLGASDRCLRRAIAAMAMCRRRRLAARLVIGVQLNPFAAHAWVQLGDKVLVGDFEQCRLFTPILALQ
jgi:hypothetical protein